jgi:hypothetical protein
MKKFAKENLVQLQAVGILVRRSRHQYSEELVCDTLTILGAEFRDTINDWERTHGGEVPSAEVLIWLAGEHLGKDPVCLCDTVG